MLMRQAHDEEQSKRAEVIQERIQVKKETRETGQVVIHVTPGVKTEQVRVPLARETVEVKRVEMNQLVDAPSGVRHEGDVTIVPVYEEVLVVTKQLVLREEIQIRRVRAVEEHVENVELRTEEAHILRAENTK
jgi:stress response protein YsnF